PDGGDGVRQEATADRRLVPVDGLDQADDGDLDQVGGGLAAVLITAGEPVCQREVGVDDLLAQHGPPGVARWQLEVLDEQRLEAVELAGRRSAGRRWGSSGPFRGEDGGCGRGQNSSRGVAARGGQPRAKGDSGFPAVSSTANLHPAIEQTSLSTLAGCGVRRTDRAAGRGRPDTRLRNDAGTSGRPISSPSRREHPGAGTTVSSARTGGVG